MSSDLHNSASTIRLCLRLVRYAFRRWKGLLVVLAITFVKTGIEVLKPLPMKVLVDNVLNQKPFEGMIAGFIGLLPGAGSREGLLLWTIGATILLFFTAWALGLASAYANIGFGQRMIYDLAEDLFGHLQRLSLRFHSRKSVGDLIRRITTDTGSVSTIVNDALLPVVTSVFTLISMFFIMWQMDAVLTGLALIVIPLMILTVHLYSKQMNDLSYRQHEIEGEIYDVVEQTLSAIPIVKAYTREEHIDKTFRDVTERTLGATIASAKAQFRFKVLIGASTAVGTALMLWMGGHHVLEGHLTVGSILVFLSYLGSMYGPLESLMYTSMTINEAAGSGRRVMEILDTEREVEDRSDARTIETVQGHVRFENVSFGYESDRQVLNDISFEALPGQTVAIVGRTGAGKSTLVSLIPRFFDPGTGTVTIDGYDICDIKLKSLRDQIGIVLQEPFLFPMTIAENIAYGQPGAPRDDIVAAARASNAHQFIEQLPDGYDTVVGERGANFSGGERQRLSIARALLKNAPILILDEPTSALDAQTEAMLLEALERLMKGRTTFIIAHRLSTVRKADNILVIEDGRIVERGGHDKLINDKGLYSRFHDAYFHAPMANAKVS
ncbi:MAG: ABC transporter ATP-binding protein [Pyrinomonadaceae bacterium]